MSVINLLGNTVWSEKDVMSNGRAIIASQVSEARQNELRTILLGHIAGMRTALPDELAEIGLVQTLTEDVVTSNAQARVDMALLNAVLAYEVALARLALPEVTEPATVIVGGPDGVESEVPNPVIEADASERLTAFAACQGLAPEVVDLWALRHPVAVVSEVLL